MKAYLMFRDRDFDPARPPPPCAGDLVKDLGLEALFAAMAGEDKRLAEVARAAVLSATAMDGGGGIETILYRQAVLRDCLAHAGVVRPMYDLAVATIEAARKTGISSSLRYPN